MTGKTDKVPLIFDASEALQHTVLENPTDRRSSPLPQYIPLGPPVMKVFHLHRVIPSVLLCVLKIKLT